DTVLRDSGIERLGLKAPQLWRAVGCSHCRNTGYSGRTGIHELFVLDDKLRRAILDGDDAATLHHKATDSGMQTLYEDGLQKVVDGVTSLDELLNVTEDQTDA
ncbi:MAG: type II secretion system protein GspE, partial [Limnohabitans sp.]